MPRSPEDNQRIKDERREALLVAAASVFARRGLAATKISDIAQAAGLSHGLVYHYFDGKEAVYVAVVRGVLAQARATMDAAEATPGTPLDRLTAFVALVRDRTLRHPENVLLVLQVLSHETACAKAREAFDDWGREGFGRICALLVAAQESGEIDPSGDPSTLATALLALLHGLAFGLLLDMPVPRSIPSVEVILNLLRPTGRRARRREAPRTTKKAPGRLQRPRGTAAAGSPRRRRTA